MTTAVEDDHSTEVGGKTGTRGRAGRARRLVPTDLAGWAIGLLVVVLGAVFVIVDLVYNSGNLIAPIDDAYIHLQYGSQLGSGHPFQYNNGDPISTGASSVLYAFVLAAGHVVGFHGPNLLAFAVVFGVLCMALTAVLTYRLGWRLVSRTVGIWSGALVALSGPLLWGAVSGMEVGLVALLTVATVLSFAREQPRFRYTPVLAFFLALVRPEGMLLTVALCAAMLWMVVRSGEFRGIRALRAGLWVLLPVVAIVGQYLFYWIATGAIRANGVAAKSHFFDQPIFYFWEFLDRSAENLRGAIDIFSGLTEQDFAFPAALFFALGGGAYLLYTSRRWRPLLTAIAVGYAVIALSVSTLSTALVHELRYWQPFMPIFFLLAVSGVYAVTQAMRTPKARRAGLTTLLVVATAFSVAALPKWAASLGRQSTEIRQTDVSVGAWIKGNLPPDAVVAVKDVGAVAYFGDRRVVDLIGLASNGFAKASNNGTGSLYERLVTIPAERRPDYFAVYNSAPGPAMQPLRAAGLLGEPLAVFPLKGEEANIVPFAKLSVFRANWQLAGSGDRAPVPGEVMSYVDVGSLDSEEEHQYQARMALTGSQPETRLQRQGDVLDSGRHILGGERFTVRDVRPGHSTRIVTRLKSSGAAHKMSLRVNGEQIETWDPEPTDGKWQVRTFVVPADAVTSSTLHVEVGAAEPFLAPYPDYTSFGYWVMQ